MSLVKIVIVNNNNDNNNIYIQISFKIKYL